MFTTVGTGQLVRA